MKISVKSATKLKFSISVRYCEFSTYFGIGVGVIFSSFMTFQKSAKLLNFGISVTYCEFSMYFVLGLGNFFFCYALRHINGMTNTYLVKNIVLQLHLCPD